MTRDEIFALFTRREAAWRARDAASLTADHAADGVVVSPTGGVLEGLSEIERIYRVWFTAFPDLVFTTEDLLVDENRKCGEPDAIDALDFGEALEHIYRVWFTAFPDLVFTTEDLLVDENRAALLCRITGSHAGEFFGMPPTGRRIEVSGCFIYRLNEGRIAHERRILDFTGLLVQVGVLRAKPAG